MTPQDRRPAAPERSPMSVFLGFPFDDNAPSSPASSCESQRCQLRTQTSQGLLSVMFRSRASIADTDSSYARSTSTTSLEDECQDSHTAALNLSLSLGLASEDSLLSEQEPLRRSSPVDVPSTTYYKNPQLIEERARLQQARIVHRKQKEQAEAAALRAQQLPA